MKYDGIRQNILLVEMEKLSFSYVAEAACGLVNYSNTSISIIVFKYCFKSIFYETAGCMRSGTESTV